MIRAYLADGTDAVLDARYGDTVEDMQAALTADSLTGSAVPLDRVMLATWGGGEILYGDVNAFVTEDTF